APRVAAFGGELRPLALQLPGPPVKPLQFLGGLSQSFVGVLYLLRPPEDLGFQALGPHLEAVGKLLPLDARLLEVDELGDVLDPMNDVGDLSVVPEDRQVDR